MGDNQQNERQLFSEKMIQILNQGALNLAMGLGYRMGLFDAMDALKAPSPVSVISKAAGLNARYVLEWLGVMATGGIVILSRDSDGQDLFYLPKAHADVITRRSGNANLGVYTQEIPLLTASVYDAVADGFRTGQGISYDHYPRFQRFMGQLADAKHNQVLVDLFLPSVEKGKMVEKLKRGISVCDLGCAEGVALILMAEAFPNSRFVGLDISEAILEKAEVNARAKGLRNITFLKEDAALLEDQRLLHKTFDYVTAFDAIHDQTRPLEALKGVFAILKDGGVFSMVDIAAASQLSGNMDHPMGMFLYTVSLMHCMPVGLMDGGAGLGMMWGREKAVSMLKKSGFDQVSVEEIPEDPFNLHFFCRK